RDRAGVGGGKGLPPRGHLVPPPSRPAERAGRTADVAGPPGAHPPRPSGVPRRRRLPVRAHADPGRGLRVDLQGTPSRPARALGDERLLAHAVVGQMLQRVRGSPDLEDIRERAGRAVPVFEAAGDDLGLAKSWRLLAYVPYIRARASETEEALKRSILHARRAGAQREEA